jgi:GNAT superfamily N-acetyltransferase/ribosomal protein S18 acetylase RimI-like enzyme
MPHPVFIIRPFQPGDLDGALKLSIEAGWNQTKKDWMVFAANPQNIFVVAECEQQIIGTTTAMNYANRLAWIGMVLVDKNFRGNGLSKLLLAKVFNCLENMALKLDATKEGRPVYQKFDFHDEYEVARMTLTAAKPLPYVDDDSLLVPVIKTDLASIADLDELVFGVNRWQLLHFFLTEYSNKAWMFKENNRITGFILGRDGYRYHHVGPVVAPDITSARMLITKAISNLVNLPVVMDIPCHQLELISWLRSIGFTEQRTFTRMYQNNNPMPGITSKQYALSGPEFG